MTANIAQATQLVMSERFFASNEQSLTPEELTDRVTVTWPKGLGLEPLFSVGNNKSQLRATSAKKFPLCQRAIQLMYGVKAVEAGLIQAETLAEFQYGDLPFGDIANAVHLHEDSLPQEKRLAVFLVAFGGLSVTHRKIDGPKRELEGIGLNWSGDLDFMRAWPRILDSNKDKDARVLEVTSFMHHAFSYIFDDYEENDPLSRSPAFGTNLVDLCGKSSIPYNYEQTFENQSSGFYLIYRKTRSGVANRVALVDLIVRDALWIRPSPPPDGRMEKRIASESPSGALGYYFSAIDRQVYELTSVSYRDGMLLCDAIAFLSDNQTKSLCLYLGELRSGADSEFSFGSIVGTTYETKTPGSWSVVAVRPDLGKREVHTLNAFLESHATTHVVADDLIDRAEYDEAIKKTYRLATRLGLCGVFYSASWEVGAEQDEEFWHCVSTSDLADRKLAFYRLFTRTPDQDDVLNGYVRKLLFRSSIDHIALVDFLSGAKGPLEVDATAREIMQEIEATFARIIRDAVVENQTITSTPARNHQELLESVKRQVPAHQIGDVPHNFIFSVRHMEDTKNTNLLEFQVYLDLLDEWQNEVPTVS